VKPVERSQGACIPRDIWYSKSCSRAGAGDLAAQHGLHVGVGFADRGEPELKAGWCMVCVVVCVSWRVYLAWVVYGMCV